MPEEARRLFKTAVAAHLLNISAGHLKLQMQEKGGPLLNGTHYVLGQTTRSSIQWDVEACRATFNRLGMIHRRGAEALRQQQHAALEA